MLTALELPPYVGTRDPEAEQALENKRLAAIRYLTERRLGEYGAPLADPTQGAHTQAAKNEVTKRTHDDERRTL